MSLDSLNTTVTRHVKVELKYDLDDVATRSLVHVAIKIATRTTGKCLGLTNNYPKSSGDLLMSLMEDFHPGACLLQARDTKGNR